MTALGARAVAFAPRTPLAWLVVGGTGGALVGAAVGAARGGGVEAVALAAFFATLGVLAAVDLRERRLPNALTYPGLIVALLCAAATGAALDAVGGLALAGGAMALFWRLGGGRLGLGDVKLGAFAGAALGTEAALSFLLFGSAAGALVAAAILAARRDRRATLPYGPCLALGAALAAGAHGLALA